VEEDIEEMRAEERAQQSESHISTMELICSPTLRPPLIIGIVMQLSQQFSGINAVFYYSTSLFMSSGLTEESAKFATIGIGAIMVGGLLRLSGTQETYSMPGSKIRILIYYVPTGCNDPRLHSADGSHGSPDPAPLWPGRNVHILHLHHHLVPDQGKYRGLQDSRVLLWLL